MSRWNLVRRLVPRTMLPLLIAAASLADLDNRCVAQQAATAAIGQPSAAKTVAARAVASQRPAIAALEWKAWACIMERTSRARG